MAAKREQRVAEIAATAVEPLSRRGLRNVTLDDLGTSLGMSGAHLLYYFASKNDLFATSLRSVESDLRARVLRGFEERPSARERWEWVLDQGAPSGLADSGLLMWLEAWSLAAHDQDMRRLIAELEAAWQQSLREVLELGVATGELPDGTDIPTVVEGVSALLDGLTLRVVLGYRPLDHDAAMRIVRAFTAPLLPWREEPA